MNMKNIFKAHAKKKEIQQKKVFERELQKVHIKKVCGTFFNASCYEIGFRRKFYYKGKILTSIEQEYLGAASKNMNRIFCALSGLISEFMRVFVEN